MTWEEVAIRILPLFPPEQVREWLVQDMLKDMTPEERARGLAPEERLKGMTPEEREQMLELLLAERKQG